jgi:hypothetical protein
MRKILKADIRPSTELDLGELGRAILEPPRPQPQSTQRKQPA